MNKLQKWNCFSVLVFITFWFEAHKYKQHIIFNTVNSTFNIKNELILLNKLYNCINLWKCVKSWEVIKRKSCLRVCCVNDSRKYFQGYELSIHLCQLNRHELNSILEFFPHFQNKMNKINEIRDPFFNKFWHLNLIRSFHVIITTTVWV